MNNIQIKMEGITFVEGREFKFADISDIRLASGKTVSLAMFTTEGAFDDMMQFLSTWESFIRKERFRKDVCVALNTARIQNPEKNRALVVCFLSTIENITKDHHEATALVFTALKEQHRDKLFLLFLVSCEVMLHLMEDAGVEQLLDRDN